VSLNFLFFKFYDFFFKLNFYLFIFQGWRSFHQQIPCQQSRSSSRPGHVDHDELLQRPPGTINISKKILSYSFFSNFKIF
jgi:hypothetical protein